MGEFRGKYQSGGNKSKRIKELKLNKLMALPTIQSTSKTSYSRVIFKKYKIVNDKYIVGVFDENDKPKTYFDNKIAGQYILPSLYDLYLDINHIRDAKEINKLIINWCKSVSYPYYINRLNATCNGEINKYTKRVINIDSKFEIRKFLFDLDNICSRLELYLALEDVYIHNNLNKLKSNHYGTISKNIFDIIDGMPDKNAIKFLKNNAPIFKYQVIGNIPPINIFTRLNKNSNYELSVSYSNVFEIANFAFQRMLCDINIAVDETNSVINSNSKLVKCPSCGRHFIKSSNRQIYCGQNECEKVRKKINKRNYDARKKTSQNN